MMTQARTKWDKNDICFDSNPSDSYCTYRDSYNAINQHATGIDCNDINSVINKSDSSNFTTRFNITVLLGGKFKSIIYSLTSKIFFTGKRHST